MNDYELSDKDLEQISAGFGKASRDQIGSGGGGSRSGGGYGAGAKSGSGYGSSSRGGYGARPAQAPATRGGICGPGGCN